MCSVSLNHLHIHSGLPSNPSFSDALLQIFDPINYDQVDLLLFSLNWIAHCFNGAKGITNQTRSFLFDLKSIPT